MNPHFSQNGSDLYVPDSNQAALKRTTHLGVGAHQDDLEFMAMHGIIECYDNADRWFGGVTCTNGAGSARTGEFAHVTDVEMQAIRAEEQREASRVGQYSFMAQLHLSSASIKDPENDDLENDLVQILSEAQPDVIYTHNLADKHSTHIAVAASLIKALRRLPFEQRPKQLIGCEVWRNLDWLPDDKKIIMDLSARTQLASKLNGLFVSQISGGKRYDLAVDGRRRANATFFDSHSVDDAQSVAFGVDLTPLIIDDELSPENYIVSFIEAFKQDVRGQVSTFF
ncbi:PIG-L family deacetylase [Coraliomargarita sp. SDUM461004]|uniref:PIG-L family deacetylase n=1 Tax=Thalassobacterium sedimentorum TaxID=3041258 RepID=A0ABU1AGD3_9BACT|nr:PIG-L family deacetylase [Coraliomargarita sp. SDUM461004]MDQ8193784.1 PIG-L family deacetylase [Coraliomargarita sp. SDUM461004]